MDQMKWEESLTALEEALSYTFKDIAHLVLHKVAFQPVGDVARRFISAAFGHRTVLTQLQHLFQ